jgi:hypothetical protein
MVRVFKKVARAVGLDPRWLYQNLSVASLNAAARDQGLDKLIANLRRVVPDLSGQYTTDFDSNDYDAYWEIKLRGIHAFQVQLAVDAIARVNKQTVTVADIGDSAGTHAIYINDIVGSDILNRFVSVNLDPIAVEKIKARGGDAILCRAEELDHKEINPDLYLSFETLEHLTDPLRFLHDLSSKGSAQFAAITVPYRKDSRFGGDLMRQPLSTMPQGLTAERTHIFELNPADWQQLARFAGWRAVETRVYRQYPMYHPLRAMAPLWRALDFEGFLGLILERDTALSDRYQDW